jgi:hypothetical protein
MTTGIKNTLELFDLGLAVAKAGKEAMADGKVNLFDVGVLLPLFPKVAPALADAEQVAAELKDLDESETAELLAYAKTKLPEVIDDADLRRKVVVYLKAGLAIAEAISVSIDKV